jgi:hypothetical protein
MYLFGFAVAFERYCGFAGCLACLALRYLGSAGLGALHAPCCWSRLWLQEVVAKLNLSAFDLLKKPFTYLAFN